MSKNIEYNLANKVLIEHEIELKKILKKQALNFPQKKDYERYSDKYFKEIPNREKLKQIVNIEILPYELLQNITNEDISHYNTLRDDIVVDYNNNLAVESLLEAGDEEKPKTGEETSKEEDDTGEEGESEDDDYNANYENEDDEFVSDDGVEEEEID